MHRALRRFVLGLLLVLVVGIQMPVAWAQLCGADEQFCNGRCIDTKNLCILEPVPGATDEITSSGIDVFFDYVNGSGGMTGVWQWAFRVGVAIAVLNGVFGGFQIVLSNGDSSKVDAGKTRFMGSAIGLAILLLSGVILNFINPLGFEVI